MESVLEQIKTLIESDEKKAMEFKEALTKARKDDGLSEPDALCVAAAAIGIQASPEAIEQAIAAREILDEDELNMVSGGTNWGDCLYDHACTYAWKHDGRYNESCFSEYYCTFIAFHDNLQPEFQ